MPKLHSNNSQLTVIGTPHEILNSTKNAWWSGWIDLTVMQDGDTVDIETLVKISSVNSQRRYKKKTYYNTQTEALLLPTVPSDLQIQILLTQTTGSPRTIDWRMYADG